MERKSHLAALHDMALFVEVARVGSFSGAGKVLGIPNATVSRRIAALERALDVRLFHRSTRRVELTNIGRRYLERCAHLIDEARVVHEQLRHETEGISGVLRVSMPVDFAVAYIGPVLPDFARQYPAVRFELDLSPRHVDLVTEKFDVAVRLGSLQDSGLVARRIGEIKLGLFASPIYLQMHGQPEGLAALAECELIDGYPSAYWQFAGGDQEVKSRRGSRFVVNNVGMMRVLAERGMGIALLPLPLARDSVGSRHLVRVLPDCEIPSLPIQAVMMSRKQPAAVRAFIDFVVDRLASQ